jgi:hypothetical protein
MQSSNLAGSMFNISIVNNVSNADETPRVPIRADRERLAKVNRSQSFNVTGLNKPIGVGSGLKYTNSTRVDSGYSPLSKLINRSNSSSLQRLHDNTEPLKSPDVLKIVRTASLRRGLDSVDAYDSNDSGRCENKILLT